MKTPTTHEKIEVSVTFSYGAMSDSLEEQAKKQGFTLGKEAEKLEKIKNAINMCDFHVATDSQASSMTKKLHKKVLEALALTPSNKEKLRGERADGGK